MRKLPLSLLLLLFTASLHAQGGSANAAPNGFFNQWGGINDGKMQEPITPGMIVGKCAFHPSDPKARPGLAFGAGMQIATSQFHTYNRALVITARLIF
jgi:hypothetical protein